MYLPLCLFIYLSVCIYLCCLSVSFALFLCYFLTSRFHSICVFLRVFAFACVSLLLLLYLLRVSVCIFASVSLLLCRSVRLGVSLSLCLSGSIPLLLSVCLLFSIFNFSVHVSLHRHRFLSAFILNTLYSNAQAVSVFVHLFSRSLVYLLVL